MVCGRIVEYEKLNMRKISEVSGLDSLKQKRKNNMDFTI